MPAAEVAPAPVAITRATVIATAPFEDERAAAAWLESCRGRANGADDVADALGHVNRALAGYRVAAADPYVRDVSAADAVQVRLGYGSGQEIVEGAWHDAYRMPPRPGGRRPRRRMLAPDDELARILGARSPGPRPSEELVLRARLDLDHGRHREAALQAQAALQALRAELHEDRRAGAEQLADAAARLVQATLAGRAGDHELEELDELVTTLERTARKRRYST